MEYCAYSLCGGTPASCRQGPDKFVYPQAMICEGLSNYWLCNKQGSGDFQPSCMYYSDAAGTIACKLVDDGAICAWACLNNFACYGTELAMKYFAYNPNVDCHYFMIRTAQEYANF